MEFNKIEESSGNIQRPQANKKDNPIRKEQNGEIYYLFHNEYDEKICVKIHLFERRVYVDLRRFRIKDGLIETRWAYKSNETDEIPKMYNPNLH